MDLETVPRYAQISPKAYEHPADRAATSALHAVPLMDKVIKRLTDLGHERRLRQVVIGNAVRIGPNQIPDIWARYVQACTTLDLPSGPNWPELYVTNTPWVNAATMGAHTPIVVANSALLASYTPTEITAVLAHEVGHVLSEHYYYTTALILLSDFVTSAIPRPLLVGLPVRALYLALLEWARAAELSCDRASALVMGDPLAPCQLLMRLAGGALPGMDLNAFVAQATQYQNEDDLFSRHARFWVEIGQRHPFPVRRVKELVAWVQTGEYDRIRAGEYPRRGQEPPVSVEFNAAVSHYRERFSAILERTLGDVGKIGRQFGDWLRRRPASGDTETNDEADGGPEDSPEVAEEETPPAP